MPHQQLKSLLCRSFIQRSEVSFWPPGTLLRGWCKTRDEITKHRDCPYCSFCFEWNLAMLRSSELTSLRSEISCLPQKTSVAQAMMAQASMECLSKSSSPLTQRDAPQEHGALFLHPPPLPSFKVSSAKNQRSFQTLLNNVPTTHKRSTDLSEEVGQVLLFISWKWSIHHLLCQLCLLSALTWWDTVIPVGLCNTGTQTGERLSGRVDTSLAVVLVFLWLVLDEVVGWSTVLIAPRLWLNPHMGHSL